MQILLGRDLELGACHFLTLIWKYIVGCIFTPDPDTFQLERRLWTNACRTFADRALALQFRIHKYRLRSRFKPTSGPSKKHTHRKSPYAGFSKRLLPLAFVDPYGDVRWSHAFAAELSACKLNRYLSDALKGGNA